MKSGTEEILKDQKLLTRFVQQVYLCPDTPALIQFVAGDEDYLLLCGCIVNASADDARVSQELTDICRKFGLDVQILIEMLTPVAPALGLAVSSDNQSDYYELLGVPLDADAADIKKAFRKKVRKVHPDTSGEMADSGQEFIHLKGAYQILSDPVLRAQYDETIQHVGFWREKSRPIQGSSGTDSSNPLNPQNIIHKWPGRSKIFYQLGILFLLMILAAFIFDFFYRQNSIFDGDPTVKQEQVTEPQTVKDGSQKKANITPLPQITKIRFINESKLNAEGSKLKANNLDN
jgi:DnaJ-domain-containing protein 1